MPSSACPSCISSLILTTPWGVISFSPFPMRKLWPREFVTFPRPHSKQVVELGFEPCLPRPSMPALYGPSVLHHPGKKLMHHKIILIPHPLDAFRYVPFLCYPQLLVTMPHIDVLTLIGLKLPFGKSCDVLLPNQLLTPPFIPPHRHSDTSGSLSCLFFFFFLSSSLLSWTAPMTLFPSIHSLYWHQSTLESTFLFLYLFVFIYLLIFLFEHAHGVRKFLGQGSNL